MHAPTTYGFAVPFFIAIALKTLQDVKAMFKPMLGGEFRGVA
jgi:hypothetical protein